jgi:hypothetical protein
MKGQSSEIMNIVILVVSMIVVLTLSYFLFSKTGTSLKQNLITESRYETVIDLSIAFYNAKVAGTHRSLAQLTGDSISLKSPKVPYGIGFGLINVENQLKNFFDTYLGENWALIYRGADYGFEVGYEIPKIKSKVTYNILVPLPTSGRDVAELTLYMW